MICNAICYSVDVLCMENMCQKGDCLVNCWRQHETKSMKCETQLSPAHSLKSELQEIPNPDE